VNCFAGVPTEIVPYQSSAASSVSESLPVWRFCPALSEPASECTAPVLRSNAAKPRWIFATLFLMLA
jgi:hypothetical protein